MHQMIRSLLLRIPPLRRQLERLAELESVIQSHRIRLDSLTDAIGDLRQNFSGSAGGCGPETGAAVAPAHPITPDWSTPPYGFERLVDLQGRTPDVRLVLDLDVSQTGGTATAWLFGKLGFEYIGWDLSDDRLADLNSQAQPGFLSGHFRLDLPPLLRIAVPHLIVSILQDPVERILMSYNVASRQLLNPWHDEIVRKGMSVGRYAAEFLNTLGPQYAYFDDSGLGTLARSGAARREQCLENLVTRVALFGLADRFDEFRAIICHLFGRVTTVEVAAQSQKPAAPTLLAESQRADIAALLADDIWFYEQARLEYERRVTVLRMQGFGAAS